MAFQIVDDVLDLTASEDVLGKPVASDLREGKVTMAVIHALERCTPEEREKIETVLRDRAFNGVTHADILAILHRYGSLEAATARAAQYAESASKAICTFPDTEIKRPCCGLRSLWWRGNRKVSRQSLVLQDRERSFVQHLSAFRLFQNCQAPPGSCDALRLRTDD